MLFALVVCHFVVASVANPFHKYPFVFLLDVGNEELDKTNTEQIRVSIPGGSLALRYPAVGDGETITNVRVSGIDFGTELKANIIDGGPGYKYVFLVFSGNTGIPYDAVITLQTVASNMESGNNDQNSIYNIRTNKPDKYQTDDNESDLNNSAEEMDTSVEKTINNGSNEEIAQSSSNVFNYVQAEDDNEEAEDDNEQEEDVDNDVEDKNNDNSDKTKNIHTDYNENVDDSKDKRTNDRDPIEDKLSYENFEDDKENQYRAEKLQAKSNEYVYSNNNNFLEGDTFDQGISLDEDAKMYRQDTLYDTQGHDNVYSAEDSDEFDQMFNDEEVHNDANKYKDSNNNNFDSDYDSAVAY
ncbi:unnamed protein product [Parnassius apollo]|uniref:(apollo) hypothetical protein n=1 Tax=Parnassius apollo TaxID=110799 RepID=A0A8S3Y551_PARAO|nr:unnamed protein product [Parnassius apollo]